MLRTCREREVRVDIEVKKALDQSNTIAERTVSQTQALKTISKILDVSAGPAFIKSFTCSGSKNLPRNGRFGVLLNSYLCGGSQVRGRAPVAEGLND